MADRLDNPIDKRRWFFRRSSGGGDGFGPLSLGPDGASHHGGTEGLGIFRSVLASLVG